jgi:cysteine desulfurase/selenocysteine lyase
MRAGHHCAQLIIKWLEVAATLRVSFYIYNTKEDCDKLVSAIQQARVFFTEMGF